jgi:hypothetical protein
VIWTFLSRVSNQNARAVKNPSLRLGLALLPLVVVVACAADGEPIQDAMEVETAEPAKMPDTAPPREDPPAKVCVSSCTQDSECQNSCPALDTGIQCCDAATSVCFASAAAACPVPPPNDPDPPPAY